MPQAFTQHLSTLFITLLALLSAGNLSAQRLVTFENFTVPQDSFLNGQDTLGGFENAYLELPSTYDTAFNFWSSGWALSNKTDSVTSGFANLYSAKAASGHAGSSNYLVGQQNAVLRFKSNVAGQNVQGVYLTNGTYAYNSMRDGDQFAEPFGGPTGEDPDFFKLVIRGFRGDTLGADSVEFFLADYRFEEDSLDYILRDWRYVDLTALGPVDSLQFTMRSSDVGEFGINTPLFFCLDNPVIGLPAQQPEDAITFEEEFLGVDTFYNGSDGTNGFRSGPAFFSTVYDTSFNFWASGWALSSKLDSVTSGFTNLYAAKAGIGAGDSPQYAVGQQGSMLKLDTEAQGSTVNSLQITNGTYTYNSMRDGDQFAKQFGGPTGEDPDFFKLTIRGFRAGAPTPDSVAFFLADYRFEEDSLDYIVRHWQEVDLTLLGPVDSLQFVMSSSDVGEFGINTPLFFCIDNVRLDLTTDVEAIADVGQDRLHVYPNPAVDWITVDSPSPRTKNARLELYDMNGRLLLQRRMDSDRERIKLQDLPAGMYLLRWWNGREALMERVIKR